MMKIDLVSLKNKKNEAFGEGCMSKTTNSFDKEILGRIKTPLPHIPELHTRTPRFGRECRVMVF
jgi:hypothetical protein